MYVSWWRTPAPRHDNVMDGWGARPLRSRSVLVYIPLINLKLELTVFEYSVTTCAVKRHFLFDRHLSPYFPSSIWCKLLPEITVCASKYSQYNLKIELEKSVDRNSCQSVRIGCRPREGVFTRQPYVCFSCRISNPDESLFQLLNA